MLITYKEARHKALDVAELKRCEGAQSNDSHSHVKALTREAHVKLLPWQQEKKHQTTCFKKNDQIPRLTIPRAEKARELTTQPTNTHVILIPRHTKKNRNLLHTFGFGG